MIAEVLTLMFHSAGVKDDIDLMRCNILAIEIETKEHDIESIKKTSAYLGCNYDVPMSDEFLQSLLDKKAELIKMNDKIEEKLSSHSENMKNALEKILKYKP